MTETEHTFVVPEGSNADPLPPDNPETEVEGVEEEDKARVWRQNLMKCLDGIESAGDFAVLNQHSTFPNPGLQVAGLGNRTISLPLTTADAKSIQSVAKQSTYGHPDVHENIVDTSVRKTWELQPSEFQLANPQWESYFKKNILHRAAEGLGLEDVTARLHKLLLYEKGSFFKRHKDSETEDGVLGTLVVCLPSPHVGGSVHLSFGSETKTLATDSVPLWDMTALAWFSDVSHEVAELTDGYRIVLTYKLVQTDGPKQSATFFHKQQERLIAVLKDWDDAGQRAGALYYPLDHLYAKQVLSTNIMIGRDRAVCHSIRNACAESGLLMFLARISHIEYHDEDYKETTLGKVYTCEGARLIDAELSVGDEDILRADPFSREPDGYTLGGYREGQDHVNGNDRWFYVVAVLVPRRSLGNLVSDRLMVFYDNNEVQALVSVTDEQLRRHADPEFQAGAVKIFMWAFGNWARIPHPNPKTIQTMLHWALEWDDHDLYEHATCCCLKWKDRQDILLSIVGPHLESLSADQSEIIDWDQWFGYFTKKCSLAALQLVVQKTPSHLTLPSLQDSFRAWGQGKLDSRFNSQRRLEVKEHSAPWASDDGDCGDDHDFLIRSIESRPPGSEWVTTCMLPAVATRGTRELQLKILDTFFTKRESEHFASAKEAFEYIIDQSVVELALRPIDIRIYEHLADPKAFVTLLEQCLTLGAGEQAVNQLETSADEIRTAIGWSDASRIVPDLLVPLASLLQKHCRLDMAAARELFVTIIRDRFIKQLPADKLDWSHASLKCELGESAHCIELGQFLESKTERTWRCVPADDSTRAHIESLLSGHPDLVRVTKDSDASSNSLIVTKTAARRSAAIKKYNKQLDELRKELEPLKGDFMRDILGDECYREIICLEGLEVEDRASSPKRAAEDDGGGEEKKVKLACRAKEEAGDDAEMEDA